jgi:hypothetical protein
MLQEYPLINWSPCRSKMMDEYRMYDCDHHVRHTVILNGARKIQFWTALIAIRMQA